jgi:ABC-type branched-subunit amino acid transport system ATPase component/ABC-type branched-subunit amino acid transport system permease subunit
MDFIRFGLLGLATGALYAVVAQGMVLVYRSSGLINFAQTAILMVGAYAYFETHERAQIPTAPAVVLSVGICALLGAAIHLLVLRPMRHTSPLTRVIATLGVLIVLYSVAVIRYSQDLRSISSILPTRPVTVLPGTPIGLDRILIFVIGCVLTAGLWGVYRFTAFGRVTTAVAENEMSATTLGHSPDFVATVNWAVSGALAGVAGILIAPITYLEPTTLSIQLLVFPLAAALMAGFRSFPICLAAAWLIGVAQSELSYYVHMTGVETAAPFVLVIAVLVVRGRGIPLRGTLFDRLPAVGSGRIRPLPTALVYIAATVLVFSVGIDWATAITVTVINAIICLSVVVVTGYAGQLSLTQYVLAGVAALFAARLAPHMPFVAALLVAVALTAVGGLLVGLPAIRTRGVTLAVVTLGVAVAASAVVLGNAGWAGGQGGLAVPSPSLFGWNIDPLMQPNRYSFFSLTVLTLLCLAVANLRRGVTGRRLLAVRSNERAAASLGVNVAFVKSYAFVVGAAIAAVGGVLLAFMQPVVLVSQFTVFAAITIVGLVVVGGVGSPIGAVLAAALISGGVTSQIFNGWGNLNRYLPLIGGVLLLLNLRFAPDGVAELMRRSIAPLTRRWDRLVARLPRPGRRSGGPAPRTVVRVEPRTLQVRDLSVYFGGVKAVDGVSIEVRPGEVHGLIGPNGAGKTTVIDAITGFVPTKHGSVTLGTQSLDGLSASRRARGGMARAFQSLELFSDLTVEENVAVACETGARWRYLTDFLHPGRIRLTGVAAGAIDRLGLDGIRHTKPDSVSYGARKVIAIARAIAGAPSILLLDEPAAGLDDAEADELAELIAALAKEWGIGVLLVDHKIDLVLSVSDRLTVLHNGVVLDSGTPEDVRRNPAVVDAYLGAEDEPAGALGQADGPAVALAAES